MALPKPEGKLVFEGVSGGPPDLRKFTVHNLGFTLEAGQVLGITGPSAAGKSTLARLAVLKRRFDPEGLFSHAKPVTG